jgi:hypothetical protein
VKPLLWHGLRVLSASVCVCTECVGPAESRLAGFEALVVEGVLLQRQYLICVEGSSAVVLATLASTGFTSFTSMIFILISVYCSCCSSTAMPLLK